LHSFWHRHGNGIDGAREAGTRTSRSIELPSVTWITDEEELVGGIQRWMTP
jgi:hypothetical protein